MATYTSFLNLEKPTTSETFNLLKLNQNWDKIDQGVSSLNSKLENYRRKPYLSYIEPTFTNGEVDFDMSNIMSQLSVTGTLTYAIAQIVSSGTAGPIIRSCDHSGNTLRLRLNTNSHNGTLGVFVAWVAL